MSICTIFIISQLRRFSCFMEKTDAETERIANVKKLFDIFEPLSPIFTALADPVRQTLLLTLMQSSVNGMNVGDLTAKTHLSRPAISHHLKVLKDCGLIVPHKVGTQIFYYFKIGTYIEKISTFSALLGQNISSIDRQMIQDQAPWMLD